VEMKNVVEGNDIVDSNDGNDMCGMNVVMMGMILCK